MIRTYAFGLKVSKKYLWDPKDFRPIILIWVINKTQNSIYAELKFAEKVSNKFTQKQLQG
jgi:hypothetical protein